MHQLITARTVLTGVSGQRTNDGAVLIEDGTIVAAGPRHEVEQRAPREVRRRDYPKHTLLPGLINAHVHLAFDTTPDFLDHLRGTADPDLLLGMTGRAQQALSSGVTTVRDLGDRGGLVIRLREAIDRGEVHGPRILAAAAPLTVPQGHCWFLGGEVAGERAIREQVRHNAALGADVIKVMASGGQITPNSPSMRESQFSTEELRVVVEEAAAFGLPVAAHGHGTESITSAVAAGVHTVEHCTWLTTGGDGFDKRQDVAERMAELGIAACCAWPPRWREFMDRLGPDRAAHVVDRFHWMDELGVPLITGTDAGLRDSVFDDFVGALELYAHLGFPIERIIEIATVRTATALGHGDHIGRIAPGYDADVLVVEGDPLAGLDALRDVRLVLSRGREALTR